MRIGELAITAAVNVQTVRFYERKGLLAKPARSASGYRDYDRRAVDGLKFIRSCQQLGFTLQEIKEVLDLHRVLASPDRLENLKPGAQASFLATANRRLALIDEKLKTLGQMKKDMTRLVAALTGGKRPVCPVSGGSTTIVPP